MTTTPKWFYNIKQRCLNKNNPLYKNYGGRGIQYKLTTYLDLIKYLGEKPNGYSLDRIDNDGHYELKNLRWATNKEQANNRREPLIHKDNQIGIKGISIDKPSGRRKKIRYLVQVTKENKRLKLYNGVSLEKAKLILNEYKKGLIK